jgi:hypothetical protein
MPQVAKEVALKFPGHAQNLLHTTRNTHAQIKNFPLP